MAKGIDLSKFKHVSSDKNSTRLKHDDGHFLVIAHKGIKGDLKAHLDALSADSQKTVAKPDTAKLSKIASDAMDSQDRKGYAEGKEVFSGTPADSNSPDFDPNKSKPPQEGGHDSYAAPATQKHSDGSVSTQDTRSLADKTRQVGHDFKQAVGAPIGAMAEGGPVRKMYADPQDAVTATPDQTPTTQPQDPNQIPFTQDKPELAPGLAEHLGHAIGKWGIGPVIQGVKAFGQDLGAGVNEVKAQAGNAINGLEKGAGFQIPTPTREAAQDTQQAPPQPQGNAQAVDQASPIPAQAGTTPAATGAQDSGLPAVDPITQGVARATGLYEEGLQNKLAGEALKPAAVDIEARAAEKSLNASVSAEQDAVSQHQANFKALNKERLDHIADIEKGYIDPEQYWKGDKNGNGGHSKIASAIGMILAGFDPAGRANGAVDMLKYQMDKNIDAQKTNLNQKNNLLNANLLQFNNLNQATEMTRIMQGDIIAKQLKAAGAKAATPMAQAAAYSAAGQIEQEASQRAAGLAMMQTVMQLGSGGSKAPGSVGHTLGYLDQADPEKAKDYRSRYVSDFDVPGGKSIANRPIPQADRDTMLSSNKFDSVAKHLQGIMAQHKGIDISRWDPRVRAQAAQDSMLIQSLFREGTLGTVYKSGEQPLLDKAIRGQPLDMMGYFTEPTKLQGLIDNNNRMKEEMYKNYDVHGPQQTPQDPMAAAKAWVNDPKNANDPRRAQILKRLGQ